jgi:sugar lactone lactonase YvrE
MGTRVRRSSFEAPGGDPRLPRDAGARRPDPEDRASRSVTGGMRLSGDVSDAGNSVAAEPIYPGMRRLSPVRVIVAASLVLGLGECTNTPAPSRGSSSETSSLISGHPTESPQASLPAVSPHVAARLHLASGAVDVAVGRGSVWVSGFDALTRIDSTANRVLATIDTTGVGDSSRVAVGEGSVWVTGDPPNGGGTVYRIDPATNRVIAVIRVGGAATGIAVGGGSVWVSSPGPAQASVFQIDAATNQVVRSIRVGPSPGGMLYAAGSVWVTTNDAPQYVLWRLDPATGRVSRVGLGVFGQPGAIAYGDGAIWTTVNGQTDSVLRIDPITDKVLKQIPLPFAEQVTFGGGWVWVLTSPPSTSRTIFLPSAKHPGTIRRVDPQTDAATGSALPVRGLQPIAFAFGARKLWVIDYHSGTVTRIDL